MSHLEIIMPFGIPPATLAKELVKHMKTPALASLLAYARDKQIHEHDEFARQLPHEDWLARDFETPHNNASSPALTHQRMQELGIQMSSGYWFTLSPIHIHIARDHMVMTDQRRLDINDLESHDLFEAAREICEELGKSLLYGDAKTWFLRADDWRSLQTASLDAAAGHNMEIWIAKGEQEVAWRKLQNEIQMLWHIHPVNHAREEKGRNTINSVWLHSGSAEVHTNRSQRNLQRFDAINYQNDSASILVEDLLEPALNSDWGNWLACINQVENNWFKPALNALQNKQIKSLKLVLSDGQRLCQISCRAPQAWKFWRKPNLQFLIDLTGSSIQKNQEM
ncbi:hypothetical protein [Undibacterium sp. Ji22W]|uniref:hypothetical protein n=1 Tax=Undibacterium sp. Ji22W TaxID=3413038 RepID=UPI003BF2C913